MNLLFRLIKWIFGLVREIAMWMIKQIIIFIRFASPHAVRLLLSALWASLRLSVLSLISLVRGIIVAEELARHWHEEALANGFPIIWERQLMSTFLVLAYLAIVVGFVIILFTTYFTLNFGYELIFVR